VRWALTVRVLGGVAELVGGVKSDRGGVVNLVEPGHEEAVAVEKLHHGEDACVGNAAMRRLRIVTGFGHGATEENGP
jgi:hypothetical protein